MSAAPTTRPGRALASSPRPGASPCGGRRGGRSLTRPRLAGLLLAGLLLAGHLALPVAARTQTPTAAPADTPRPDSLRLATLTARAVAQDPRAAQRSLQADRAALQLRTIAREVLPTLAGSGQAQYQSQVTRLPIEVPLAVAGGRPFPLPPNDTYDASVRADLTLGDPSRVPRRAVRRAQLAEAQAQVEPALYDVRQQVTRTFFALATLDVRRTTLAASLADLEARRAEAARRVRAGAALPSEAGALAAELLRRRQELEQVDADRAATVVILADWTGAPLAPDAPVALPDEPALAAQVAAARAAGASLTDTLQARPELAVLAARRERLGAETSVVAAARRPRLGAFARAGYGRPGLNFLARDVQGYWLTGLQLQWAPFDWGRTDREREALRVEQAIVGTEEAAFRAGLARATRRPLASIDRLSRALVVDDSIVALRTDLLREASARFREGVLTAADYVDRQTDLLNARLARAAHRIELAEARVDYLTILGLETRP